LLFGAAVNSYAGVMGIWASRRTRRDAEELARRTATETSDALREILSLRSSIEDLRRELREVAAGQKPGRMWATIVALGVTSLLIGALLMILHGTLGLGNQATNGIVNAGTVSVGVVVGARVGQNQILPFPSGTHIGVAASFETDNNIAFYRIYFPKEFAGRKFVLMLQDGAVFSHLVDNGAGKSRDVDHRSCTETGGQGRGA
jgi:hypothetical protein